MTRTGVPEIDSTDEAGKRALRRLLDERIGWLTTVAADGTPQASPIWFLWDGDEILLYSLDSPRVRNLKSHPRVSLNLDGNGLGGDIVIAEGTAVFDNVAVAGMIITVIQGDAGLIEESRATTNRNLPAIYHHESTDCLQEHIVVDG